MVGDCDKDEDCDGDLLCGRNNCGPDDLTGGEMITTWERPFDQASWIVATGNVAHQTMIALMLGWFVNHKTFTLIIIIMIIVRMNNHCSPDLWQQQLWIEHGRELLQK